MVKLKKETCEKKTCCRHDEKVETVDVNATIDNASSSTSNTSLVLPYDQTTGVECTEKDGVEDMVELFVADSASSGASASFTSCALRTSSADRCCEQRANNVQELNIKTNKSYALENDDNIDNDDDEHFMIINDTDSPTLTKKLISNKTSQYKNYNEEIVKIPNLANLKQLHTYVAINTVNEGSIKSGIVDSKMEQSSKNSTDDDEEEDEDDEEVGRRLMNNNQYGLVRKHGGDGNSPPLRSRTPSVDSTGEHCRVCHCRGDEVLIAPCSCNGSLKYVHETCLITWMKNPFKDSCEICKQKILIVKKRKPIYTWKWPLQRPTPLVWVIVFTTAICVNLMSVVKDATQKCVTTSCIIFYVIGSVGIILASMFLYFWVKRVKVFCESWKVQNEHWVVKIEDEANRLVV